MFHECKITSNPQSYMIYPRIWAPIQQPSARHPSRPRPNDKCQIHVQTLWGMVQTTNEYLPVKVISSISVYGELGHGLRPSLQSPMPTNAASLGLYSLLFPDWVLAPPPFVPPGRFVVRPHYISIWCVKDRQWSQPSFFNDEGIS